MQRPASKIITLHSKQVYALILDNSMSHLTCHNYRPVRFYTWKPMWMKKTSLPRCNYNKNLFFQTLSHYLAIILQRIVLTQIPYFVSSPVQLFFSIVLFCGLDIPPLPLSGGRGSLQPAHTCAASAHQRTCCTSPLITAAVKVNLLLLSTVLHRSMESFQEQLLDDGLFFFFL